MPVGYISSRTRGYLLPPDPERVEGDIVSFVAYMASRYRSGAGECWRQGIGRAYYIEMSTPDGFSLPGSARYWETGIIEPPVTVAPNGNIDVPSLRGYVSR